MGAFSQLLVLLSLFCPLLSFDCFFVSDQASCDQLAGCLWTASTCTGSFTPLCPLENYYYIDPTGGSDTQEGSAQYPFKTLTGGFKSLTSQGGSLIIVNYPSGLEVEILGFTIISSSIEIKPLFENNRYILSLAQFDSSTFLTSPVAISIASGALNIAGLTINNLSTKTSVQTLFDLGSAQLFFNNVILSGGGPETINLVKTSSANAQFNSTEGSCINCNWTFQLLEGSHTVSKMIFTNLQTTPNLFDVGGTLYINDTILIGGGNAEALFINMQIDSTVYLQNITVNNYSGNFIDADSITQLILASSAFYNLDLESSIPFVRVRRFNGYRISGLRFRNLVFENIKVKNSLFLIDEIQAPFFLINITVNNLFKKPVIEKTLIEIGYKMSWPGGIFFLGRNDVSLMLSDSRFYNIGSHCIGINTGGVSVTNSIFDNSRLNPASAVQPAVDENDDFGGVTWITMIGNTERVNNVGFEFTFSSNIFNENKIRSSLGGALRLLRITNLRTALTNNTFHGLQAIYGGAIYCDNPWNSMTSKNEFYSSNSAVNGGAIYKFTSGRAFLMKNKLIYLGLSFSSSYAGLKVSGTTFQGNSALDKGGAFYLDEENLDLVNSNFRNNRARFGGALCVMAKKMGIDDLYFFKNNIFVSNTAIKSGGAIFLLFQYQELNPGENDTSVYIDNADSQGQAIFEGKLSAYNFSFYEIMGNEKNLNEEDLEFFVSNSSLTKLVASFNISTEENPLKNFTISHKSGQNIDQILVIEIYDQNGLPADYIDDEKISIDIISTQNSVNSFQAYLDAAPQIFTFTKGKIYIKNKLTLMGQPTTTATLSFSSIETSHSFIKGSNLTLNRTLKVYFRNCDIGDIFNSKTKMCETCPQNTYSLTDPYLSESCKTCDTEKLFCLGGQEIAPKPGYWRYDISTDHILQCPKSSACLGGYVDENYDPKGKCVFPYEGNLCNQCAEGYAKSTSQSKTCINCAIDVLYYLKSIGFFLQQVITAFYSVRTNIKSVKEMKKAQSLKDNKLKKEMTEKQIQSNIIRIAINYIQTFSLLLQLKFEWPTLVNDLLGITTNIAPTNQSGFSFDCFFALIRGTNEHLYFINIVIRLIKPFCMWLLLCFLDFLWNLSRYGFQKGIKRVKKNSMILFLIPSFMYQTSIIQATFELFRCQNFSSTEHPIHFMVENPEVQCWTSSHLFWCLAIGLPNLFLWALLLPAFLFRMLWKKAKQLQDPQVDAEYSFIYVGLKPEKFYWEFITLLRKVLIVTAFVFLNIISIPTQVFVIFLIIVAFGYLQFIFQPYNNPKMNTLEMSSFLILGITTCSSMTLLQGFLNEWFSMTMVIISCVLNILFFVAMAFLFVKNYRSKAKKHVETAKTLIRKLTQRVSSFKKSLSLSSAPTESKSQVYKISPKTTERNLTS